MKKVFFILLCVFALITANANDVIILKNSMAFQGSVLGTERNALIFSVEKDTFYIPTTDLDSVLLDPILHASGDSSLAELCMMARMDAELYHGKKVGHFFLGALFGPFALIGTALSNPTPYRGKDTLSLSKNGQYFQDPTYLTCYKKKAKGSLLIAETLGWAAWIILALILTPSAY